MKSQLKPLGTTKQQYLLGVIKDALQAARMEHAAFHDLTKRDPLPKTESDVTSFIMGRTRLYRESWIIAPLKEIERTILANNKKVS